MDWTTEEDYLPTVPTNLPTYLYLPTVPTYLLTSRPLIHGSGTSPILLYRSGEKSPGETSSKPGPGTSPLVKL